MKVKVEIDATPEEYRRFFGLPDVSKVQNELMEQLSERIKSGLTEHDPVKLMEPFLTGNMKSIEAMQNLFWSALSNSTPRKKDSE